MRQLKFRTWNETYNNFEYIDINEIQVLPFSFVVDEYPKEQYTGEKDKNGKEIYEGDIIHYKDETLEFPSRFEVKGVVHWDDEELQWCVMENCLHELWDLTDMSEVIGNIHENPEQLRGSTREVGK